MALVISLVGEADLQTPALMLLIIVCLIIVAAFALIIFGGTRRTVDLDPYAVEHGDVPGFDAEQLRKFQSSVSGDREKRKRVRA